MKHLISLAFAGALSATSLAAQTEEEEGKDLMERGMELLFEGLREEMSPALKQMREMAEEYGPALFSFVDEMGPAFGEMLNDVKDWAAYHPPEVLPNGDIIIRKKIRPEPEPEATPVPVPEIRMPPQGQTDL
ncbi:hypothetical protein [Sedimentitalea todarodis]|uniref:AAA+ family ATPase n=1 Tax=Sedimentitalea todarodis TaxID=1631240 RepID=A0ABU3VJM7_9RHOB|nr:hypothetical protein [Sedimentitalea todarodis]MDU9006298.1 hypothetical protein [Sedimentitalea todarodis]